MRNIGPQALPVQVTVNGAVHEPRGRGPVPASGGAGETVWPVPVPPSPNPHDGPAPEDPVLCGPARDLTRMGKLSLCLTYDLPVWLS